MAGGEGVGFGGWEGRCSKGKRVFKGIGSVRGVVGGVVGGGVGGGGGGVGRGGWKDHRDRVGDVVEGGRSRVSKLGYGSEGEIGWRR